MSSISSLTSSGALNYTSKLFSKMDTDKSGGISKDEFTSSRPSDVSESQASALFDSLDTSDSGSLSQTDLEKLESSKKSKGHTGNGQVSLDDNTLQALLQSLSASSTSSSTTTQETNADDIIAAMDTDGNGTVTKDEFLAARPDDVSEEMATNLWDQFDTESSGSLSTSELKIAMTENRPMGPPRPPPNDDDEDSDTTASTDPLQTLLSQLTESNSSTSTESTSSTVHQAFLDAVKAYDSSAGYNTTKDLFSSLMALV